MGYLLQILLAIGAQSLVEAGIGTGERHPWLVLALCVVPHACALLVQRCTTRGSFRIGALGLRLLLVAGPLLYLSALAFGGWQASLEAWTGARISSLAWPRPVLLLVYAPFVVYELLAIDARARLLNPAGPSRNAWRGFQARMFASSTLPVLVYIVVSCLVGMSAPLRTNVEHVALYGGAYATLLLLVLALCLPFMLRNTWETSVLTNGVQRDLLLAVARRAQFRARALLVWNTGHQMANAAIIGIGARSRVVLFSDLLMSQLELRELAAVFAHEIGHAVRHHVPIFVVWAVVFVLGADLLVHWIAPDNAWLAGALILVLLGAWYVSFGFLSRRFELDADLFSLELLGDPRALINALERVGGGFRDIASWRHFSTARRVRFLEHASIDASHGARLRRNLRGAVWIGCALFALVIALELRALGRTFDADRVGVDLRLGRYASASERVQHGANVDATIAALVARAGTLDTDRIDELEARARAALRSGDAQAAVEWLDLGALREREDMDTAATALRELLDPTADDAGDVRSRSATESGAQEVEIPDAWRADLDACLRAR